MPWMPGRFSVPRRYPRSWPPLAWRLAKFFTNKAPDPGGPPNFWLLAAGVMSSLGQILYFYALNLSTISRVALLGSMEIFVTLFLAWLLLRRRESLTPALLAAAALGFGGSAFIILH